MRDRDICRAVEPEKKVERELKHRQPYICKLLAGGLVTNSPVTLTTMHDDNDENFLLSHVLVPSSATRTVEEMYLADYPLLH